MLTQLPEGIYIKYKEFEIANYITVIIDKKKIKFEVDLDSNDDNKLVPDFMTFLLIVDSQFPISPPRVLTKTNVYY